MVFTTVAILVGEIFGVKIVAISLPTNLAPSPTDTANSFIPVKEFLILFNRPLVNELQPYARLIDVDWRELPTLATSEVLGIFSFPAKGRWPKDGRVNELPIVANFILGTCILGKEKFIAKFLVEFFILLPTNLASSKMETANCLSAFIPSIPFFKIPLVKEIHPSAKLPEVDCKEVAICFVAKEKLPCGKLDVLLKAKAKEENPINNRKVKTKKPLTFNFFRGSFVRISWEFF